LQESYLRYDRIGRTTLELTWPDLTIREPEGRSARLEQTLVATFESVNQAHFAVHCLRTLSQLDLIGCRVLSPGSTNGRDLDGLRAVLGDGQVEHVAAALLERQHILIATVGERGAHLARAALIDDARSLRTVLLPPRASSS
jgi:hypothetical protein